MSLRLAETVGVAARLAACRTAGADHEGDLPDGFTLEGTGGDHPGTWLAPFVPSFDWLMRQMPKPG